MGPAARGPQLRSLLAARAHTHSHTQHTAHSQHCGHTRHTTTTTQDTATGAHCTLHTGTPTAHSRLQSLSLSLGYKGYCYLLLL